MQKLTPLEQVGSFLEKGNLDFAMIGASDNMGYPRLLVAIGDDYKKRERILEITAQEQLFSSQTISDYLRIQFKFLFPFSMSDLAAQEVGSLILFLNQMLELPGFELIEVENKATYRYVLLTCFKGIDAQLISGITGLIILILDLFTETIERLAEGKNTFNELLDETLRILEPIQNR